MRIIELLKQRWVVWVWNHTPNCAEMSRLASRSFEHRFPVGLRLRMAMHYFICVWCSRYLKHLGILHAAAVRLDEKLNVPAARGLSAEAKQCILKRMQTG